MATKVVVSQTFAAIPQYMGGSVAEMPAFLQEIMDSYTPAREQLAMPPVVVLSSYETLRNLVCIIFTLGIWLCYHSRQYHNALFRGDLKAVEMHYRKGGGYIFADDKATNPALLGEVLKVGQIRSALFIAKQHPSVIDKSVVQTSNEMIQLCLLLNHKLNDEFDEAVKNQEWQKVELFCKYAKDPILYYLRNKVGYTPGLARIFATHMDAPFQKDMTDNMQIGCLLWTSIRYIDSESIKFILSKIPPEKMHEVVAAVMQSAQYGQLNCLELAVKLAIEKKDLTAVQLLLEHGAKPSEDCLKIAKDHPDLLAALQKGNDGS